MKIRKHTLAALAAAVMTMTTVGCSESEYDSPLSEIVFDDITTSSSFNVEQVEKSGIKFDLFNVSSSAEWCLVTTVDNSLFINTTENTTYEERTAIITLVDPEDNTKASFKVIQAQNNAILTETDVYDIPMEGGTVDVKVQYNVDYDIVIPEYTSWITYTSDVRSRALSEENLRFTIAANNSADKRQTVVKLIDTTTGTTRLLTFNQDYVAELALSSYAALIGKDGGYVEVYTGSNVYITSSTDSQWCTIENMGAVSPTEIPSSLARYEYIYKFRIKVAALTDESTTSRTASIHFQNSSMEVFDTFIITQTAN